MILPEPLPPVNPALNSTQPNVIIPTPPNGRLVQAVKRSGGIPPADEHRYVPNEVVVEVASTMKAQRTNALARGYRLAILQSVFQLGETTLLRARITDRRAVPVVVRTLEADAWVLSAQPNYLYTLIAGAGSVSERRSRAIYSG